MRIKSHMSPSAQLISAVHSWNIAALEWWTYFVKRDIIQWEWVEKGTFKRSPSPLCRLNRVRYTFVRVRYTFLSCFLAVYFWHLRPIIYALPTNNHRFEECLQDLPQSLFLLLFVCHSKYKYYVVHLLSLYGVLGTSERHCVLRVYYMKCISIWIYQVFPGQCQNLPSYKAPWPSLNCP